MSQLRFIDAHHHLWDLDACHYPWLMAKGEMRFFGDPTPIQQHYRAEDFLGESSRYRPTHSVHIQVGVAEQDIVQESAWLQQQCPVPDVMVAFADLAAADLTQTLDAHSQYYKLRGVRQIVGRHVEEDQKHNSNALLANPAWIAGLKQLQQRQLSFDLQMIPPQMPAVLNALRQVPDLAVALCHCGSPWDQSPAGLASWRKGLKELAELPNTHCKVSGLGMFNHQWQCEDIRSIILNVIDIFGTERVMFGSNFPVDKLYGDYETLWHSYESITQDFSSSEKHALFFSNAASFYQITTA
jgi:predicted TIM-barrel fold metal-dependent hydrolase